MARIRPFHGLRYDSSRAGEFSDLLAPPYDVVDGAARAELSARSPHNCIEVILPQAPAGSEDGDAKYDEGARRFREMIKAALVRDPEPGYYVYHQRFESEGRRFVRKGVIALVELTRFGEGPVLAHERTMSGPKADRLKLMRACDAHLELVFGMFSDPEKRWEQAVRDELTTPVLDCDFDGVHHILFRVADVRACAALAEAIAPSSIYIADGHHRYETMCSFRDELEAAGRTEEARWGMMYLSNLDDEGLVVLPTHRIVYGLDSLSLADILKSVSTWFDVEERDLPPNVVELRAVLSDAGVDGAAFGLAVPGSKRLHVLRLRADYDPESAGLGAIAPALQRLDVALLHELVLERALGIDKEAQVAKTNLRYFKSSEGAMALAREGGEGVQLVCFMNATPVQDVVNVCDSGEVMPQKSTFFYPKIPTGLVFHSLRKPD